MKQFIYPYLLLENVMDAATYYKEMFEGEFLYIMYGKDTPNCPIDRLEEIVHLQLKFQDNEIFMSEAKGTPNDMIQLHLDYESKDDLIAVFNRFRPESVIVQDLGETHWGAYFGVIKDKYGVTWQFHYMLPHE